MGRASRPWYGGVPTNIWPPTTKRTSCSSPTRTLARTCVARTTRGVRCSRYGAATCRRRSDFGSGALVKVFLVDDHEVERRGLIDLLGADPEVAVAGEAGAVAEQMARIPAARRGAAGVDVRLPA